MSGAATGNAAAARSTRLAGYFFALSAGAVWGTTGPLSTALYRAGEEITGIGYWRLVVGFGGLLVYGLFHRDLFRSSEGVAPRRIRGGRADGLFEVAYNSVSGHRVPASAEFLQDSTLAVSRSPRVRAHSAPGRLDFVPKEARPPRSSGARWACGPIQLPSLVAGVPGGLLAMIAYAGMTLVARWAVPRYGARQVLFLEMAGAIFVLGIVLPLTGFPLVRPHGVSAWTFVVLLALGPVLAANFLFFAALKRIDAAPTAVAATVEPVVGTLLAVVLLDQHLTASAC